jgi:hypothetical protein
MPFKSKAQMKFMYAKHPKIAKRWEDKYGISKKIPKKMIISIYKGKKIKKK